MAGWITFDCYGTLVDWHSGFSAILRPLAGEKTSELLHQFHEHEPKVEAERPFQCYKEILTISLLRAANDVGLTVTEEQARSLPRQWSSLPIFEDVEPALAQLRSAGYKLGVLTNCDEDLFGQTHQKFEQRFDLVVTAERVKDYKPSLSHFQFFAETTRVDLANWAHVACSTFHDIVPSRELGIKRIWLDRDRASQDAGMATVRLFAATELPSTVSRLLGEST